MNLLKELFYIIFHRCRDNFVWESEVKGRWLTRTTWKKCKVCGRKFDERTSQH